MARIDLSPAVYGEQIGRVLVITINRPEAGNTVNPDVTDGICKGLDMAEADVNIGAVVLTGAGPKFFCSGMDLKSFAANGTKGMAHPKYGFAGLITRDYPKPLICAVNGYALGGGCEVVLACDIIVSTDKAQFGFPEVKRGIYAAGLGPVRAAKSLTKAQVMELALTGDFITAQKACEWGLINKVVPAEQLMDAAMEYANKVADNAPLGIAGTKRLIIEGQYMSFDEANALNQEISGPILTSQDAKEGPRAFAEKRKPVWTGK